MTSSNEQPIPAARPVIGEEEIEAAVRVLRSGRSAPSDVVTGETVSDKCANILVIQLQLR